MRYKKVESIGEGGYGRVYKAEDKETGQLVAMKKQCFERVVPAQILLEISVLQQLQHENIVQLLDTVTKREKIFLIFELFEGDLHQYMAVAKLEEPLMQSYPFQLLSGVKFIHENGILHRDLKPQNLLIDKEGALKICDFGLACERSQKTKTRQVATLYYRAPELLLGSERYDSEIDLWSVGCILGEMILNEVLFYGDCEIGQLFTIFNRLGTPTETSWPGMRSLPYYSEMFPKFESQLAELFGGSSLDLISRLLAYPPETRLGSAMALLHPYLDPVRGCF